MNSVTRPFVWHMSKQITRSSTETRSPAVVLFISAAAEMDRERRPESTLSCRHHSKAPRRRRLLCILAAACDTVSREYVVNIVSRLLPARRWLARSHHVAQNAQGPAMRAEDAYRNDEQKEGLQCLQEALGMVDDASDEDQLRVTGAAG
jgi:hypothetical protein